MYITAILKREIISNKLISRILGWVSFVILTSLGAFVRIPLPFTPVPITLQTFFVLLSGAFLGSRLGLSSQLGYILLGILGLPIFSGAGRGLLYLLGPTGGYLLGFILASFFMGRFIRCVQNNFFSVFLLFCVGDFILLMCGVVWLKLTFGYSLIKLLIMGFFPFIPGDLLKAFFATLLYQRLKSRLKELF